LANTIVSLLRYCKTASGWRRMRVSTMRKGRGWSEEIETSHSIIEKGEYQLRWYTRSKPKFKGVGDNCLLNSNDHSATVHHAHHRTELVEQLPCSAAISTTVRQ
jgi:hypothetical protein